MGCILTNKVGSSLTAEGKAMEGTLHIERDSMPGNPCTWKQEDCKVPDQLKLHSETLSQKQHQEAQEGLEEKGNKRRNTFSTS